MSGKDKGRDDPELDKVPERKRDGDDGPCYTDFKEGVRNWVRPVVPIPPAKPATGGKKDEEDG